MFLAGYQKERAAGEWPPWNKPPASRGMGAAGSYVGKVLIREVVPDV